MSTPPLTSDADAGASPPRSGASSTARVLAIGFAAALFVALSVTAQTYLSMLGHGHSFWRMLWWQLSVSGVWALLAPALIRLGAWLHATRAPRHQVWATIAGYGALAIAAHLAVTAQLSIWLRPFLPVVVPDFVTAIRSQFEAQFATDILVFAMLLVLGRTLAVSDHAQQLALRESKLEAELARAHLEALRLEIQPHFLFNTLNSIAALIRMQANDKALEMLLGLGALMRATIDRPPDHLTPLSNEVAFVRQYLDLQAARFGDRLDVRIDVGAEALPVQVPSFLLQPLVENALRHGLARKTGRMTLDVRGRISGDTLLVEVCDDGAGLPPGFDVARDGGTGLRNIRSRLQQLYGSAAQLGIDAATGGGTRVSVRLPAAHATALSKVSA